MMYRDPDHPEERDWKNWLCCCSFQNKNKWKISICLPPLLPWRKYLSSTPNDYLFVSLYLHIKYIAGLTNYYVIPNLSLRNCQASYSLCTLYWKFQLTSISKKIIISFSTAAFKLSVYIIDYWCNWWQYW